MNYKNHFENMESEELKTIVADTSSLSYEAKLGLIEVLESRGVTVENSLTESIEAEKRRIANLKYLRNLGFSSIVDENQLLVKRRTTFIVVDVISILVGFCLSFLVGLAWTAAMEIYSEGLAFSPLLLCIVCSLLGLLGLGLFYRSLTRVVEFAGFKIVKDPSGNVTIKKNSNEFRESVLTTSMFDVKDKGGYMVLVYSQSPDEEIELIRTRGGIRHQQTLHHLKSILSKN